MSDIRLHDIAARSIIAEARASGKYDGQIHEDESKNIEAARELTKFALEAFINSHDRSDAVKSILGIAGIEVDKSGAWEQNFEAQDEFTELLSQGVSDVKSAFESMDEDQIEAVKEAEAKGKNRKGIIKYEPEPVEKEPEFEPQDKKEKELAEKNNIKEIEKIENLGFPISDQPLDDVPQLPIDYADINDDQLMKLYGVFASLQASVEWLLGKERTKEQFYNEVAEHRAVENRKNVAKIDPDTSKPKANATIEREYKEVSEEDNVLEARKYQGAAKREIILLERMKKTYEIQHTTISRIWTYREYLLEHSGNLPTTPAGTN